MTDAIHERHRRAGGFSLPELMVAMAVGTIVLLVTLGVLSSGSEGYAAATGRIDANVETRAVLSTFSDDLATVRYSAQDEASFAVRQGGGVWPSSEVWFFALKPRRAQESSKASGDRCFAYYYTAVTRELEGEAGSYSRKLYRRLVSSGEVMAMLRDGQDFRDPQPDPERLEDEAVAFNVLQFLVEPRVLTGDSGDAVDWSRAAGGEGPDFLDVTLRVTDDRTAALFPGEGDWDGEGPLARQFLGAGPDAPEGKRVRTFTMRLPFDD